MNQPIGTMEEAVKSAEYEAEKAAAFQKLKGAKNHASHIADEVKGAARDLGEAAKIGVSALRDATVSKASSTRQAAQSRALSGRSELEARVREEPVKFLGISLGIGFVLGWLFRG